MNKLCKITVKTLKVRVGRIRLSRSGFHDSLMMMIKSDDDNDDDDDDDEDDYYYFA